MKDAVKMIHGQLKEEEEASLIEKVEALIAGVLEDLGDKLGRNREILEKLWGKLESIENLLKKLGKYRVSAIGKLVVGESPVKIREMPENPVHLYLIADPDNDARIWISLKAVEEYEGWPLDAGDSLPLRCTNPIDLYFRAASGTQKLYYVIMSEER